MTVTLKTVAAACGLDVSTVSRALRGDPRVAVATRTAARAAATRLGYRPNLAARALQAGATRTLWCLVGSLDTEIERRLAIRASEVVEAAGYDLLLACHRSDAAAYARLLQRLDQGLADGALIVAPTIETPPSAVLRALLARRHPLVFLDRSPGRSGDPTVTTDNDRAARELVRRLAASGAKRMAVHEPHTNDVSVIRRRAALDEARILGLPASRTADAPWLAAGSGPLGIFATSATEVRELCARLGQHLDGVPLRFALFDAWAGAAPIATAFVAVQDFAGMAERAAERLLAVVDGRAEWSGAVEHLPLLRIDELAPG